MGPALEIPQTEESEEVLKVLDLNQLHSVTT